MIQGSDGRLYGTTFSGGSEGWGTIFVIDSAGTLTTLHSFGTVEGPLPDADLVEGSDGSLYGPADSTIYRIDATGTLTTVHAFTGTDGSGPAGLIRAVDGILYGTTTADSVGGGGTIYRLEQSGTLTTLHYFRTGMDGATPNGIIEGSDRRLYGTTGSAAGSGLFVRGTVFAVDADTGVRTTLDRFSSGLAGRGIPRSGLFEGSDGNFYGTTWKAAEFNLPTLTPGVVFRMTPAGNLTTVAQGFYLSGGVIEASDGNLYGTRAASTNPFENFYGDVFRITPAGSMTQLHRFNGTDGNNPVTELTEVADGTLWGTTAGGFVLAQSPQPRTDGTVFQIDRTGAMTTRYSFTGPDGSGPEGRLIQGSDGRLYGTTSAGGAFGYGTVFAIDTTGTLTTLHHFAASDGANPHAGMIQGDDGRLYGVTRNGGASNYGTMFALDAAGTLTTLYQFAFTDGAYPVDELLKAGDGSFYGTTSAGGPMGGGVVFRVRLETSPPPSDAYYEIVSRGSGKCLDVYGASTDAVAPVIQWICHGGANQQWRLEPAGGGAFRIIARHSAQALDVYGAWLDDVTPIIQYPVHGGDNQVWAFEPASDGYVRIVARHSGKALDVEYASVNDGARVIQFTPHGGANQQWLLRVAATR